MYIAHHFSLHSILIQFEQKPLYFPPPLWSMLSLKVSCDTILICSMYVHVSVEYMETYHI